MGTAAKPTCRELMARLETLGKVKIDHGETACKTHLAANYIRKVEKMGRIGKKRRTTRC